MKDEQNLQKKRDRSEEKDDPQNEEKKTLKKGKKIDKVKKTVWLSDRTSSFTLISVEKRLKTELFPNQANQRQSVYLLLTCSVHFPTLF